MVWIQYICLDNVSLGPLPPICFPYSNPDLVHWLTWYRCILTNDLFTFQVCIFIRLTPAVDVLVNCSLLKRVILDCHLVLRVGLIFYDLALLAFNLLQLLQLLTLLLRKYTLCARSWLTHLFYSFNTLNAIRLFFIGGNLSSIIFVGKQRLFTFSELFLLLTQLQLDLCYLNLVLLAFGLDFLDPATHIMELKVRASFRASVLLCVLIIKVDALVVNHVLSPITLD